MRRVRVALFVLCAIVVIGVFAGGVGGVADDWPDDEYSEVGLNGEYNGTISSQDDTDQLRIQVEAGDVVNLSLASDTPSQVFASVEYPEFGNVDLNADNPSERITVEENGYIYVDINGLPSDFESYPYSWSLSVTEDSNSDEWVDSEYAPVSFGSYTGEVNTNDDTDMLRFQVEAGEVVNLSLGSDSPSQVFASVEYPEFGNVDLNADNPSERITIEENGYVYVDINGLPSDFESYPYSWSLSVTEDSNSDEWVDSEYAPVSFGSYTGEVNTNDDTDMLRFQVEAGDVVNLSLASDAPSQVFASVEYPEFGNVDLNADNPSERITIEEEGYVYVDINGLPSDFESFPYSWSLSVTEDSNSDEWVDSEYAPVSFGSYTGEINTNDDTDMLQFQVEAGEVVNLSLASDAPSQVFADVDYPDYGSATLNADNPDEQITVDENGYIYVDINGLPSDFESYPYSWSLAVGPPGSETAEPIADAGADHTVTAGDPVALNGTGSAAADDGTLSYTWTQTAGPSVSLQDANSATPEFTAPDVETTTTMAFELTVDDGNAQSASDTVQITVEPATTPDNGAVAFLEPDDLQLAAGGERSLDLRIDNTSTIATFNFTLSIQGDTNVQIDDIALNGNPGVQNVTVGADGRDATVSAALASIDGTDDVRLATITLTGGQAGAATLEASVNTLGDTAGTEYTVADGTASASVTVQAGPGDVTGNGNAATDPDGDGTYEDVNGDGSANVLDVQSLFGNIDDDPISGSTAFDVNGDGSVNILDVQALFSQL